MSEPRLQTTDERLWRVRVVRYMRWPGKPTSKPSRRVVSVLLSAPTSDVAMERGKAWGDENAPFGQVLVSVEALEAASIQLPYAL